MWLKLESLSPKKPPNKFHKCFKNVHLCVKDYTARQHNLPTDSFYLNDFVVGCCL